MYWLKETALSFVSSRLQWVEIEDVTFSRFCTYLSYMMWMWLKTEKLKLTWLSVHSMHTLRETVMNSYNLYVLQFLICKYFSFKYWFDLHVTPGFQLSLFVLVLVLVCVPVMVFVTTVLETSLALIRKHLLSLLLWRLIVCQTYSQSDRLHVYAALKNPLVPKMKFVYRGDEKSRT